MNVCSAGYQYDGDVLILDSTTYDQAHKDFDHLFIKFFAPWCGHCKDMADDWREAASKLSPQGMVLAEIDCATVAENRPFCDPHAKGYPTLKLFTHKKKSPIDFSGERKLNTFVSFGQDNLDKVLKVQGPNGNEYDQLNFFLELNDANFKSAVTEFSNVFIHFYKECPRCSLYEQKWKRIAKDLNEKYPDRTLIAGRIDCDANPQSCEGVTSFPSIRLFSKSDSTFLEFKGNKEVKNLVNFAVDNMVAAAPKNEDL